MNSLKKAFEQMEMELILKVFLKESFYVFIYIYIYIYLCNNVHMSMCKYMYI